MSKADELAQWLVSNKDKKGFPEWEAKAAEYRREADAESTKVSPQVQQQRDADRIKTLQQEFLQETDRLKQGAPGALDNLKAISAEIVAAGGKAPPIPPPPSKADVFKEIAGQALQGTIQDAGEIARDVGPGAAIGTAGLLTGVLEARGKGPASLMEKVAQVASQAVNRGTPAVPAAPSVAPSEQQATRILQGTTGDLGTTGRQRMAGFNEPTAQAAARRDVLGKDLTRIGLDPQRVFANFPDVTATESGVLAPRSATIPPPAKPAGALEEVTQFFRRMAETGTKGARALGGVARALPGLSYPLAGYSIGEDFGAIEKEIAKERPDYADIALRGIGALGTGLSLHPATAPVGLPMATIPPLIASGRRKMRDQPEIAPTPRELEEAARPSFRMSRP